MKKIILLLTICSMGAQCQVISKETINKKVQTVKKSTTKPTLTNEEVVRGLKEALTIGSVNSATLASAVDGFYKNPKLFIPWPPEALDMKEKLIKIGLAKTVGEFEMNLNRAAEEAAKESVPIFTTAIVNMSVQDGFAILKGADTAATNYLRKTTYTPLEEKFQPVVAAAIKKVNVTKYWNELARAYNMIPGVTKQNPDLEAYVTNKAINGLMILIAEEEIKIRKDPMARVTDLLKRVFGK